MQPVWLPVTARARLSRLSVHICVSSFPFGKPRARYRGRTDDASLEDSNVTTTPIVHKSERPDLNRRPQRPERCVLPSAPHPDRMRANPEIPRCFPQALPFGRFGQPITESNNYPFHGVSRDARYRTSVCGFGDRRATFTPSPYKERANRVFCKSLQPLSRFSG